MASKKPSFLAALRRSDKIILGIVAAMVVATVALNLLKRFGLTLINEPIMLFLPIAALLVLVGWGAFALIRRIQSRGVKVAVGGFAVLALIVLVTLGFTYLSFVTYTAMPHAYKTLTDPDGKHPLVVMWAFDSDPERNEQSVEARKAARLEAYPDSDPQTLADDVTVAFTAYPKALLGLFYRSSADVEGKVFLAYTGNIAAMNVIEAQPAAQAEATAETEASAEPEATAEAAQAEAVSLASADAQATAEAEPAAEPVVIQTPHGTMMLEWLEDNTVAHFFVKDPGTAEGGECMVRFE